MAAMGNLHLLEGSHGVYHTGILPAVLNPLAQAGVGLFAVSLPGVGPSSLGPGRASSA